eukprot:CAMPEP_0206191712 /NCGR_PEP_ID=MMETSP0166-20121206/5518_1 /ASSEMBLY_ACC=CAM_ASM_000260 /TAXON_ID=95228 /ORGANISM="Vannella robusta, Strain DIVA3 518/3/11/1/6" /LENGTH=192 /DNA_ID=CAMNT_0053608053 /DNA_START=151 /DNA_END=729 /DNA_ORIENTATION=-
MAGLVTEALIDKLFAGVLSLWDGILELGFGVLSCGNEKLEFVDVVGISVDSGVPMESTEMEIEELEVGALSLGEGILEVKFGVGVLSYGNEKLGVVDIVAVVSLCDSEWNRNSTDVILDLAPGGPSSARYVTTPEKSPSCHMHISPVLHDSTSPSIPMGGRTSTAIKARTPKSFSSTFTQQPQAEELQVTSQ